MQTLPHCISLMENLRFLIDFFDLDDMFRFVTSEEEGKLPKKNSTHTLKQTLSEY